jgi:hypothetical protein
MHIPDNILVNELEKAAEKVKVGGFYYHYKKPDQSYKVLNLAVTEWDEKICVIYEAQYGDKIIFVRPIETWLDKVEWNNKIVKHFTFIK